MTIRNRGHMELGVVFIILALLAGMVVYRFWPTWPIWAKICGSVFVVLMILFWLFSLGAPSGMGGNARRQGLMPDLNDVLDESEDEK